MKFRSLVMAVAMIATLAVTQVETAGVANAYPTSTVTINGHGFGHGRGMGQYGALGYALNYGWTWQQILDRYYGGTTPGAPATNPVIGVRMIELDGVDTIITAGVPFTVGNQTIGANQAARIHRTTTNTFEIDSSGSCAGPWTALTTQTGTVTATSSNTNPGNDLTQMLQLCESVGTRGVRGVVQAVDDSGTQRTVNSLPIEDYLRGVIPRESPASWGDLGNGAGMNALEAQAVAARSYALASNNYSYATTCDTTSCQVYGGAFLNGAYIEDARSNTAVANTANVVRRFSDGTVARTEFSSSTGGFTAGGTFPSVVDDGDAYSGNPNHSWTANVNVSSIQSAYSSIGTLQSVVVTSRDGNGDFGGRVTGISVIGTSGTVNTTGNAFQSALGLKSNYFQIQNSPSGGVGGFLLTANDGGVFALGDAQFHGSMGGQHLNKPIIALAANASESGYWEVASDGGIFSYGTSQFFGSMGGQHLNQPIVGMGATPSGKGYWEVASDGGIFAYGDAGFYGSMGGQHLNKPIVAIASTPSGHGYWEVASDGGVFAFGDAGFFGSTGNISLKQPIVGIDAAPDGGGYSMVASDGGVFAYGNAHFAGSLPGANVTATVAGFVGTATGGGYAMVTNTGNIYSFGDAPQFGNLSAAAPNFRGTVLSIAASP